MIESIIEASIRNRFLVLIVAGMLTVAGVYATVTGATKDRRGMRSNGDVFSVESLGSYHLHDVVHHLHDVGAR